VTGRSRNDNPAGKGQVSPRPREAFPQNGSRAVGQGSRVRWRARPSICTSRRATLAQASAASSPGRHARRPRTGRCRAAASFLAARASLSRPRSASRKDWLSSDMAKMGRKASGCLWASWRRIVTPSLLAAGASSRRPSPLSTLDWLVRDMARPGMRRAGPGQAGGESRRIRCWRQSLLLPPQPGQTAGPVAQRNSGICLIRRRRCSSHHPMARTANIVSDCRVGYVAHHAVHVRAPDAKLFAQPPLHKASHQRSPYAA
jgi:hypothetical protein